MQDIQKAYEVLTTAFSTSPRTKDESIALLKKFIKIMEKSFEPIAEAIKSDFNKPELEFYIAEYSQAISETQFIINNLDEMLKTPSPSSLPITFSTLSIEVEKIALGTVLIISPFNYPLILAISPLVGAIATGNNVVLKLPYDQLPNFCSVLTKIIESVFPKEAVKVVNGGIPESQYLLNECKFDKIFFTGSTNVGKIVYKSASNNLTPVVLELGGKSPVFITKNIDTAALNLLLERVLWGKFTNAGQTCVAPDYLLVESSVYDQVLKSLLECFQKYEKITEKSDFSHIINERGFERLKSLLSFTNGKLIGGSLDKDSLFISPTIVTDVTWDDPLMAAEIFGPILPIVKYNDSFENTVKNVTKHHDCPLAAYLFSSSDDDLQILKKFLRSGAILVNETLMSAGSFITPFGGIGNSGFGNYHSGWSVDTFTHERAILKQPIWAETLLKGRYLPYTKKNLDSFKVLGKLPPIPLKKLKRFLIFSSILLLGWLLGKFT
jgi:acyl-CoA reductase-like NAD-dependent aldehyde dehydrogenase